MQKTGEDDQKIVSAPRFRSLRFEGENISFSHEGHRSELSHPQKLKLMEELWAELSREPKNVPMPEWHLKTLAKREKLFREGKAKFSDWSEAKKRLQRRTRR
jgi:hypothetical protein